MNRFILSICLLINPYIVATAAVDTLVYAWYDASKAMVSLSIATAKGSGTSGSAEYLDGVVNSINVLRDINRGPAQEAVKRLAEFGKLSGDNFKLFAEASARWATVTGDGADDITSKFEYIADEPLQAMLDGTVRVTKAQYDQISALVDQGQKQEAVNAATKIFYDQVNNNSTAPR